MGSCPPPAHSHSSSTGDDFKSFSPFSFQMPAAEPSRQPTQMPDAEASGSKKRKRQRKEKLLLQPALQTGKSAAANNSNAIQEPEKKKKKKRKQMAVEDVVDEPLKTKAKKMKKSKQGTTDKADCLDSHTPTPQKDRKKDKKEKKEKKKSSSEEMDTVDAPSQPIITKESAGNPEPEAQRAVDETGTTLLLFYAYVEPEWTDAEHVEAIAWAEEVSAKHGVSGRLRVAREGFNGTMTGTYLGVRTFCQAMRDWRPQIFGSTDFKLTDNLPVGQDFGGPLKIMRVAELVNYGLKGRQPKLDNGGVHLSAKDYHAQMEKPNTVIIDVRNSYEADIGRFNPPPGGAKYMYCFPSLSLIVHLVTRKCVSAPSFQSG